MSLNSRLQTLTAHLSEEKLSLWDKNKLAFLGEKQGTDSTFFNLWPTPLGHEYWLWRFVANEGNLSEYRQVSEEPAHINDLPSQWFEHYVFRTVYHNPAWKLKKQLTQKAKEKAHHITNIYFIQAGIGGPIKIGRAINIQERINQHQPSCPYKLNLIHAIYDVKSTFEKHLHNKYKKYRLHGEWFSEKILNDLTLKHGAKK